MLERGSGHISAWIRFYASAGKSANLDRILLLHAV